MRMLEPQQLALMVLVIRRGLPVEMRVAAGNRLPGAGKAAQKSIRPSRMPSNGGATLTSLT